MNKVGLLNTQNVFFANRTIETIQLNNGQLYYVYNHQGQYYKVFNNKQQLNNYFENQPYAMLAEFYQEEDLDAFLLNYKS